MNVFAVGCVRSICGLAVFAASGSLLAAESQVQSKETPRIGKYQMMQIMPKGAGGHSSDSHEAWIIDTETGRVIICGGSSGVCRFIDWKAPPK